MDKVKSFAGNNLPKNFRNRKIRKTHLIIAAVVGGIFGGYLIFQSFAATDPPDKIYGVNNSIGWGSAAINSARQQLGVNGDRVCHDEAELDNDLVNLAAANMRLTVCVNSYEELSSIDREEYADLMADQVRTYGPGGTYWAAHSQYSDYHIKSFEIMNEPYGWWYRNGDNDPAAFAHVAADAIRAGRAANPAAKFYLPLAPTDVKLKNGTWIDWNQALLNAEPDLFSLADGFSIHLYYSPSEFTSILDQRKNWAWSKPGGNGKPFIITESNLTDAPGATESAYVSAIPQFVQIVQDRSWVKELFIFSWRGYSGLDYIGFLSTNGTPRQARIDGYRNAIQNALAEEDPTPAPDTTVPTVSLTAPSNNATISGSNVTISANASDNVGVNRVEFYVDTTSGTPRLTDNSSPYNYSLNTQTMTNGSHTISAKAFDAAGNSSTATVTVNVNNPDITSPNAPNNLSATATNATTVNLSWNTASDTGANQTGVAKYNVLRGGVVIAQVNAPITTYTDSSRIANTSYSYVVQAVDGAGNVSANSNTSTVTTPSVPDTTAPNVPGNLQANAASSTQVNLSWNASTDSGGSGLAGYNVYRNGSKLNTTLITTTAYGDGTVSANTTYSYQVEAVDGVGNKSSKTGGVNVNTPATPSKRGDSTGPSGQPDGQVDLRDISYAIRKLNTSDSRADVTGQAGTPDGVVDLRDISYLIRNYGK